MINAWAARHGITPEALTDLLHICGAFSQPSQAPGMSESSVQQRVRLAASQAGVRLWRNNCGGFKADTGQFVRYGLANETAAMSKHIKSSDLVGITPYVVTGGDVGRTVGIFTAIEVKKHGWKFTGSPRETAQLRFILLVRALGGIGQFSTGE